VPSGNRELPILIGVACIVASVVLTILPSSLLGAGRHPQVASIETVQESATTLGGIDLDAYCGAMQAGSAAWLESRWVCRQGDQTTVIDMTDACRRQYNAPDAVARQRDPANNYSWTCFR
jgi:hypothetical protein